MAMVLPAQRIALGRAHQGCVHAPAPAHRCAAGARTNAPAHQPPLRSPDNSDHVGVGQRNAAPVQVQHRACCLVHQIWAHAAPVTLQGKGSKEKKDEGEAGQVPTRAYSSGPRRSMAHTLTHGAPQDVRAAEPCPAQSTSAGLHARPAQGHVPHPAVLQPAVPLQRPGQHLTAAAACLRGGPTAAQPPQRRVLMSQQQRRCCRCALHARHAVGTGLEREGLGLLR